MTTQIDFATLLQSAVETPGTLSAAYSAFHGYSLGNMLLASAQCRARELPIGPIATYPRWKELGRHVKRGEKALMLCMPVMVKKQAEKEGDDPAVFTRFIYRNNWFVLAQTDGEPVEMPPAPGWDLARALDALGITETAFESLDGNTQGYASGRAIAINPVAVLPWKTRVHEIAHIVLGHTSEGAELTDDERTPRSLREVEAEAVALCVCEVMGWAGAAESRGYIQHWNQTGMAIPEKSAQKILKAADCILKAGQGKTAE